MIDHPNPSNLDAEKAVLGAALLHPDALDIAAGLLQPRSFYRKAHQQIFAAMLDIQAARTEVDPLTLKARLAQKGELDEAGGMAYLTSLTDGMPQASNVAHHAALVREKATLRQLIAVASTLTAAAYDADRPALTILADADAALITLAADHVAGDLMPVATLMHALYPVLEDAYKHKRAITGLQTAWRELDNLTMGLHPGTLIYVGGSTSQGKSSLGLNIAVDVALQGQTVALFSLEDSSESISMRMTAAESGVSLFRMRSGYLGERDWAPLGTAIGRLGSSTLFVDDSPKLSVQELRAKCRRLQATHTLALVVVDYVQLMYAPGKHDNRTRELGVISSGLKQVAKELRVPLIVLSQLNREGVKEPRRPRLSDLRESGSLEQDADLVWLIYREEQHDPKPENAGLAELIIAKQKNGPTGTVKLRFEKETFRFHSWTEPAQPEQREFSR